MPKNKVAMATTEAFMLDAVVSRDWSKRDWSKIRRARETNGLYRGRLISSSLDRRHLLSRYVWASSRLQYRSRRSSETYGYVGKDAGLQIDWSIRSPDSPRRVDRFCCYDLHGSFVLILAGPRASVSTSKASRSITKRRQQDKIHFQWSGTKILEHGPLCKQDL